MTQPDLRAISGRFEIDGDYSGAEAYGNGHINDTYLATYIADGARRLYIHQRINHNIFPDPPALMGNVQRVLAHLRGRLAATSDARRRALTLVPTREGRPFHRDEAGNYWRTYLFIDGARTYDVVESPRHAFEAGRAFGQFQAQLADLPAPRLRDTIPHFHDTPKRFEALERAVAADKAGRARRAKPEIEFALSRKAMARVLHDLALSGAIPERITHNDTKINNVVIDNATGEALCVLDLDTVMPGLALHDFGDMVRTTTSPAAEDERDLSKVGLRLPLFEALTRGYLSAASSFLNETEKKHLAFSGKLITFEVGLRFLTDFLSGDVYFKVHRDNHNLDRCRTQFALVESIERQEEAMNAVVARAALAD